MAETSYPSPNHNSRAVTEAEYEKISARYSDDGLYDSPAGADPVVAGTGLQVLVKANQYGSLRGFLWGAGTSDIAKTITSNSSGSTRVDTVVLRLDRSTWDVRVAVRAGTPGSGAPALVRDLYDTGLYEIPLADVTVPNAASSVTVKRRALYVGSRLRHVTSEARLEAGPAGALAYEYDTGKLLQSNGSSWQVLMEDTGNVAVTISTADWNAASGGNWARKINKQVEIDLNVSSKKAFSETTIDGSGLKVATVPAGMAPLRHKYVSMVGPGDLIGRLQVQPDGGIHLWQVNGGLPTGFLLRATLSYQSN